MRSAARRNEASDYTLTISATGKALPPLPASKDALLPGTKFHASDSSETMTFTRQGDVTTVKFESDESYEIVDALIIGG
jgi:hypothetical protein